MARRFISDLRPGERLEDEVFLIKSKELRATSQGTLYIHAVLMDRTGQLLARMWQATQEIFQNLPDGGFMRFKGRTENYKGHLQFIIEALRLAEPGSYEPSEFVPATSKNIAEMWARLVEILSEVRHPELKALIDEFLRDEPLMQRFRKAPAAVSMHHAFIGGLLEHTLHLLEVARRVIPLYPKLSLDLVLVGLFLHDIGKANELAYETALGYTDEGQLLGHIVLASSWIDQKIRGLVDRTRRPFPEELRWMIQHIVVSHHGQYEFGSPKLPAIPEAVAVHHLDNLDAKVNILLNAIEQDRDPGAHWANFNQALQTKVYKQDVMGVRRRSPGAPALGE